MTVDTVFDLASLTKVIATTTAVMSLVEQGRLRLNDPVATHVPGFERYGKGGITVAHLMTHVSGLRPDVDLAEPWTGYEAAIELARNEVPTSAPGERFVYSDINFFLLGEIVRVVSGQALDVYTKKTFFEPLGMRDTGFLPPAALLPRIAPTERCDTLDQWPCKRPSAAPLRGVVHDPTARRMGGVAGHAGLFGTASDLSRFARMLLGGGTLEGVRVLAPATVARMTSRATPPAMTASRGLGWDIDSSFSSNRGELFPIGSFGHTGFTGTSVWIDPTSGGYVVFLSSRLYPDGAGDVTPLRARVATIAAAAIVDTAALTARTALPAVTPAMPVAAVPSPSPAAPVLAGIDVLARDGFALAEGQAGGARHQSHRARSRRPQHHRCAAHRAGRHAGLALQPRARHPRHQGRGEPRLGNGRQDRAHGALALRRDAAAHRRDAEGPRHHRHRPGRRRRALLHLPRDDGLRDGGGGEAQHRGGGARSAEPDQRLADRGPAAGRRRSPG